MSHKPAPEKLEIIRNFINTWSIPNETREPTDFLNTEQDLLQFIKTNNMQGITEFNVNEVKRFREDLRKTIEDQNGETILCWLDKYPVKATLIIDNILKTEYRADKEGHLINMLLSIIVEAVALNQWNRLKACPDCRYAFYDHSKNGSKKWCGMYAENSKGRACGTIDKVKRYRERSKVKN
jgi:hypothetical protein